MPVTVHAYSTHSQNYVLSDLYLFFQKLFALDVLLLQDSDLQVWGTLHPNYIIVGDMCSVLGVILAYRRRGELEGAPSGRRRFLDKVPDPSRSYGPGRPHDIDAVNGPFFFFLLIATDVNRLLYVHPVSIS